MLQDGGEENMAKSQQYQGHVNCVFLGEGIAHYEYAPPDQIINKEYYHNVVHRLRDEIQ